MLGKTEGRKKGATEDVMVGRHHRLHGCKSEQTPGDSEGQGSLARGSPWGRKESDMIWPLNNKNSSGREWVEFLESSAAALRL